MITALLGSLCWTGWVWWKVKTIKYSLALIPAAFVAVILAAPGIWQTAFTGYAGDSFWTLGTGGRMGVIAISATGITFIYVLLATKTRALRHLPQMIAFPIDAGLGLALYAVIYSVSPQVFYGFYQLIFPNLPGQIVVDSILDIDQLHTIARLAPDGSLSDHLAGVGLWAILPFTLWLHRRPDVSGRL